MLSPEQLHTVVVIYSAYLLPLLVIGLLLALGKPLSWAPLMPTGPWWNPVLFEIGGRPVQLQIQIQWVLMTPIFYAIVIACHRRWSQRS